MNAPDTLEGLPAPPDGFTYERILGEGPSGWVVRAHLAGGRGESDDGAVVLRLERPGEGAETGSELGALAALRHPGIARLVAHGRLSDGGRFVAREWVDGQDLRTWAADRSAREIGAVVGRLCAALAHLHDQGFVHGDLKPENVLVRPDGEPVLCDFGLAHRAERPGTRAGEGGASGTLFSLAPERLMGLPVTPAGDLFALGAMLHRLLAPSRTTAREFYSSFPEASFLDAMGTDPEELPEWSRDLVAALTARDPGRRPRSAGDVGRTLCNRLGLVPDGDGSDEHLLWPVAFGREAWLADWMREAESLQPPIQWLQVPAGENPRPLYEHLRIQASLRGMESRGIDLESCLEGLRNGVAIDDWAEELASEEAPLLFVLATRPDRWQGRALETLRRGLELRREGDAARAQLVCVSASDAPDGSWPARRVPEVELVTAQRFANRELRHDDEGQREAFARQLHLAARGSATRAQQWLERAVREGWVLFQEDAFRLRPGALLDAGLAEADADGAAAERLSPTARTLLDALDVCDGGASPDEVLGLVDADAGAEALLALRAEGWVALEQTDGGPRLRRLRGAAGPLGGVDGLRALHAARAAQVAERSAVPGDRGASDADAAAHIALHRLLAAPDADGLRALRDALRALRDEGNGERALTLGDRLRATAPAVGLDLEAREEPERSRALAELRIERARAWCSIGQTERALGAIEALEDLDDDAVRAGILLVRGQVASLRHRTEEALEVFREAGERHPSAVAEATLGRIQLLHVLGRDEEVLAAVEDFAPARQQASGALSARMRCYVDSLRAMSMHRLGRADEARTLTLELLAEARAAEDPGLEAALQINLSLIERGTGSLPRARAALEAAIERYDGAGLVAGLAHAKATLGGLLRETGELLWAEPLLASAYETRRRLGDTEGALAAQGMLGLLQFERGFARAAIETLEATAAAMGGAQARRFAPFLRAKALEMRARIGEGELPWDIDPEEEEADPRILLARARIAWLGGEGERARVHVERVRALASARRLERLEAQAVALGERLRRRWPEPAAAGDAPLEVPLDLGGLGELDLRLHALLRDGFFDVDRAEEMAEDLAQRGCNDRSARLFLALATRTEDAERAPSYAAQADDLLADCTRGLTEAEEASFKRNLLGEPDPWPGDLTRRVGTSTGTVDFEEEFLGLLEINAQLMDEDDLGPLLGKIVDHALRVTGAERGFLVLEQDGELRFDTAVDSCRGDIAEPELEVSATILRNALEDMQVVRVSNAVDDPLLGHRTSIVSLELRSILCVPFAIGPGLRGAIYVDHRLRNGAFSDRSARLCSLLAVQAALVIQQTARLDEIRQLNQRLEQRVAASQADLEAARRALREKGGETPLRTLVGGSRSMDDVRKLLEKAAPSSLPVLIHGESGTGKELAARALHGLSERRENPFVSENCAALPAQLIESELFGFRKGAFTGADRHHAGLFEQANGGTLFLDEVGEMPAELQGKLLRVLETGEVRRLGDNDTRRVDVRLVVATNRDLEKEVAEGRFRQDLYYRLNGIPVRMPSLSERPDDIPALVAHMVASEHPGRRVSRPVLQALAKRAWPGNVRELKNEIARLCLFSEGDLDDPELVSTPMVSRPEFPGSGEILTLAELERHAILAALEHTGGDKPRAAKLLGISRAKIYQRLKQWEGEA